MPPAIDDPSPTKARVWVLIKCVWLLGMVAIGVLLLRRHLDQVVLYMTALAWWQIVLCIASLVAGKILLSRSAADAVAAQGVAMPFLTAWSFVSLSQLGKYIPGGFWHLLGRGGLYSSIGMDLKTISKALLLENIWQWLAALLIGIAFVLPYHVPMISAKVQTPLLVLAGSAAALLAWYFVLGCFHRRLTADDSDPSAHATRALTIQVGAWFCFGFSLWSLFPIAPSLGSLGLGVGAFAIAAFAGFIVPVAPAGLGVREAALAAALLPILTIEQAAICAGLNRVAWLAVELSLAGGLQMRAFSGHRAGTGT